MPQITPPDLRPCPYCGSTQRPPEPPGSDEQATVYCPQCCSLGPLAETAAKAIAAWNTRFALTETVQ